MVVVMYNATTRSVCLMASIVTNLMIPAREYQLLQPLSTDHLCPERTWTLFVAITMEMGFVTKSVIHLVVVGTVLIVTQLKKLTMPLTYWLVSDHCTTLSTDRKPPQMLTVKASPEDLKANLNDILRTLGTIVMSVCQAEVDESGKLRIENGMSNVSKKIFSTSN